MNITLNLPDDLIERLVSGGLLSDGTIARLLADALTIRDGDAAPTKSPYYTLFDQTHDAVFMIGLDGRMMHVNPRAVQLTGFPMEELLTMTINDLSVEPMDGPNVLAKLVRGEKLPPFERNIRTKSGGMFPSEVATELVRGARGAPWYVQAIVRDITLRKQAEAEVRQAYRQAYELALERQQVQILTQFIQDSSHEFRTPLSVISTSIYLMTRTNDDAKRTAHAAQAHTQITRITRLLDQLQTMADLDSNIPFEYEPLNVNVLLREIAADIADDAEERGLTIETSLVASLPPVMADAERLRQAFDHVIDNALRFTACGGTVSIVTRSDGQQVTIDVSDTGVGIPSELVPQALQRFWRRDQAHTTPGFGLGLPIVQKIVDRHSGQLTLQSHGDCGTIVTIELPVKS